MKTNRIIYWISTGIIALGMLFSAYMYLTQNAELVEGFKVLGIPVYFVMMLGIAKLLGSIALVVPGFPRLKEWAYAGFVFNFLGAVWAHLSTHTPWIAPAVFLAILSVSYFFRNKVEERTHVPA